MIEPTAVSAPPTDQISVRGLTMAYGDFVVMRDLDFDVSPGEVFVIMGGSGCGKSTLMRHLLGMIEPAAGEIFYGGESFTSAPLAAREAHLRRFGVLFQGGALWSSMTLAENIALPLEEYTDLQASEIRDVDEPSAGLDPISSRLLDDLILELRDSLGTTFVVVTHELASIFAIATKAIFLDTTTRTATAIGPPAELRPWSAASSWEA